MNKKNLLQGLLLLIVSLTLAIVGILWFYPENGRNFSGMLVFEQTSNRGADMDKVVISNGKNKVILTLQDGFWWIPGAGNGYYANFALSNALFMNMNQSRYFTEIEAGDKKLGDYGLELPGENISPGSGTLLQTYAGGELLDEVLIGKSTPDNLYVFVRRKDDNHIWLVNNDFTIPQKFYSWFQQPLLNYAPQQIKSFEMENDGRKIKFNRITPHDAYTDGDGRKETLTIFSDLFSYLTFRNVVPQQLFNPDEFPQKRNLRVTLFNGLVTDMEIYADANQKAFWTAIKISSTRLPTRGVNDYIKNNGFFYDGWYFELPPETGYILFNTLTSKEQ